MDRGAWWAIVHGFARAGHELVTKPPPQCFTIIKGKLHIFTFEVFVSVYLKWILLAAVDEFCIF